MTFEVLHTCGCVAPRTRLAANATCALHGRCEAVGVKLLRTALSLKAPAPWTEDGPRPSDARDADWDTERWETKD